MIQKYFPKKKHTIMLAMLGGSLAAIPPSQAGELNFSGFMSVGGGFVTDDVSDPTADDFTDHFEYYGFYEDNIQFNRNLFGLQLTGDVSEKLSATVQLTARSEEDYKVQAEWAYMTYALTDESQIRFGRLRMPLYLYSDYLDVGYAYPWVSPPREVYYLAVNNIDGIDFYTTGTLGPLDTSFQAYFGGFNDTYDFVNPAQPSNEVELTTKSRNQVGAAFTLGQSLWNVRAAYHQTDWTLDVSSLFTDLTTNLENDPFAENDYIIDEVLIEDDSTSFIDLAFTFDNGRFLFVAEHIEFEAENSFLAKQIRQYATAGVRFGDFMLHGTYQIAKDERHELEKLVEGEAYDFYASGLEQASTLLLRDQTVATVGIRYDFTPGAAFKLQVDQIDRTNYDKSEADQTVVQFAIQSVF